MGVPSPSGRTASSAAFIRGCARPPRSQRVDTGSGPATTEGAMADAIAPSILSMRTPGRVRFRSDVEVLHELRVVLDEHTPRLDVVAHQRLEDLIGQHGFLD